MEQIDFLTGFLSKEALEATLDKVKAECDVDKKPFSMLVIDLDYFKAYNDKYGHLDGDDILKYFAGTLRISFDSTQTLIFRFGGDEFILVFPGKTGKETFSIARDITKIVKKRPFLARGRMYKLGFSGGIASYPADGGNIETIIAKADKAMYFSKTHGRGRTTLYGYMLGERIERILLIFAIALLIGGGLFYFQRSSYKDYIVDWLKGETRKISEVFPPARPLAKIYAEDVDSIYLKSGRTLKGIIIRDDKDEIELNLSLEIGKGSITIKKSDIEKIKRQPEKIPRK